MPFPTTSLLDDFNRPDSGSLGANWTDSIETIAGGYKIVSNHAEMDGVNLFESTYYNAAQFGPDCELYATYAHTPGAGNRHMQWFRVSNPGASNNGYILKWGSSGDATLHGWEKNVAGVNSAIGADWNEALASGDTLGASVIGNELQAYRKPAAGSWATSGSAHTDSSVAGSGYLGLQSRDNAPAAPQADDFSGGTVVTVGAATLFNDLKRGRLRLTPKRLPGPGPFAGFQRFLFPRLHPDVPATGTIIIAPAATAQADGVTTVVLDALVVAPASPAAGAAPVPVARIAILPVAAPASADGLAPSMSALVIAPAGAATAAGPVPTLVVRVLPGVAAATAAAPVPTVPTIIVTADATATAAGVVPTLRVVVPLTPAAATAAALTPLTGVIRTVVAPAGTATGVGVVPALRLIVPAVAGAATAAGIVPAMLVRLIAPAGSASSSAPPPGQPDIRIVPSAAAATGSSPAPFAAVRVIVGPAFAVALAVAPTLPGPIIFHRGTVVIRDRAAQVTISTDERDLELRDAARDATLDDTAGLITLSDRSR